MEHIDAFGWRYIKSVQSHQNKFITKEPPKNPSRSFSCSIWYLVTETLTQTPPEMHVSIWWQKKWFYLQTQNKTLTRTQTFESTLWRHVQEVRCAAPMEVLTVSRGILVPSQKWVNWGLLLFLSFYSVFYWNFSDPFFMEISRCSPGTNALKLSPLPYSEACSRWM